MKTLKFKLNHQGGFEHANAAAPLGHPIYQVIEIPDIIHKAEILSVLNSSILADSGTTFHYQDLGIGRVVKSTKAPKLTTMYQGKEVEYELCPPTPEATRLILQAAEAHREAMARRYTVSIENIDLALLKKQKEYLVSLVMDRAGHIPDEEQDALDGIINMLDAIQDKAEAQE